MDLTWTKIIVTVLFGFLRLIFGLLPIKLYPYLRIWEKDSDGIRYVNKERGKDANCVLSLLESFGGGVLFATCFLHMMPEIYYAVHKLEKYYNLTEGYPRSQLIICIGFFTIYFVEDVCQYMIDKFAKCENGTKHPDTISATKSLVLSSENTDLIKENTQSTDNGPTPMISRPTDERNLIIQLEKAPDRMLRCILITMALCFHAVFEGIAIGLQHSVNNIWYTFVAISAHSVTLLFCVGVQLLFSHKRTIVIFYFILALSLASPVGIMIGLAVTIHSSEESMGPAIASALLEGLSAGALLYITFFEVLTGEKEKTEFRIKRGCFLILGFFVMAMLQTFVH